MVNGQLVDYIKKQSSLGIPQEQIIDYLLSVGWREKEINEALWEANSNVPVPTHLLKRESGSVFWMITKSLFLVLVILWIIWEGINIYDYKSKPNKKTTDYYSVGLKVYKIAKDYWNYENNTSCPSNQIFKDESYPNCECPVDFTKSQAYSTTSKKLTPISGQSICVNVLPTASTTKK
ncbi:MAG: hypothetical protein U0469_02105 [Candidatus Paceibacterota bacterium]|jgi:hypothetical protein